MNNNQKELLNLIGADENTPEDKLIKLGEDAGIDILKTLNPTNPLLIKEEDRISLDEAKRLLMEWASVSDSVRYSVWDLVWDSVRYSVRYSVWDLVWDSVRASVWDSVRYSVWDLVGAYASSIFTNVKKWDGIEHEEGVNPFQSGIDLVEGGYIASLDGNKWRLHTGKDADVVWEGTIEDLNNKEQDLETENKHLKDKVENFEYQLEQIKKIIGG